MAAQVHVDLRRRLLEGRFPVWERLAEERLASSLGVSRTPVREALQRLEREELVVADPGGGYRPQAPDIAHLRDLYEVRMRLEDLSVERAVAADADRERLEALRGEWLGLAGKIGPEDSDADFVYREESFHLGIVEAGGNQALAKMLQGVNDRIRIIRFHDFLIPGRIQATVHQHLGILEKILDRDLAEARRRMQEHIRESASLVEDRAFRALSRMVQQSGKNPDGGRHP